jgi:hypothetical protein
VALAAAAIAVPASAQTVTTFSVFSKPIRGTGSFNPNTNTFTFRSRLVQPGDRDDVIGSDSGACKITKFSGHQPVRANCKVVFFLPAGKVKVKGTIDFTKHLNRVPVIGGTRAYNGVGGKVIVHNVSRPRNLIDFVLVK